MNTYITTRRQHRITFRNGDTGRTVTVRAARDASADDVIAAARDENSIGAMWKPESIELLRISDKTVQRTTLL